MKYYLSFIFSTSSRSETVTQQTFLTILLVAHRMYIFWNPRIDREW